MNRILLILGLCLSATRSLRAASEVQWPGLRPDGSMLLPNQWMLRPAGKQIELGDFPVNIAVHPKGTFAAVLHCGYSQHEVVLVNLTDQTIASRSDVPEAFYGLAFSADGNKLYCSGSSGEEVFGFDCANGKLSHRRPLALRDAED